MIINIISDSIISTIYYFWSGNISIIISICIYIIMIISFFDTNTFTD